MRWIWIIFAVLFPKFFQTHSIQNRIHRPVRFTDQRSYPAREFRHIDIHSSGYGVNFDWEHGLREATVQALFREHVRDDNIRKHIYSAPLLGKQNKATPFGDIAILARGQLYANYAGFIFVQDPYQNDCDDCHNIDEGDIARRSCINNHCQIWHSKNNEKLIALWTIKRIRHRSRQDGPKYEVEFTISPVGVRYHNEENEDYLTKEGTFNYHLPGHVFVLKNSETRQHLSENEQNFGHLKQEAFIAQTPDGRKYILHSFNGLLTPETPRYYDLPPKYPILPSTSTTTQYSEEDEKKVYQTLLEILHRKTSPDSSGFFPTTKTSTTLSDTTLVQFPNGQIVPITELETPFITKSTPGYVAVHFPGTTPSHTTYRQPKTTSVSTTQSQTIAEPATNKVTPESYGIMMPQTTAGGQRMTGLNMPTTHFTPNDIHTTVVEPHTTYNKISQTPSVIYTRPKPISTTSSTERSRATQSVTTGTTKPPYKMTFHFFAAEEAAKTTPESIKKPLTTVEQKYTDLENFLPETLIPTEPTIGFISESTITESKAQTAIKETTKYPIITSTKQISTAGITSTNFRPASVVKITKPAKESTKSYPSTFTTSKTSSTFSTTASTTKNVPSIASESSTIYSVTPKEIQGTFKEPIMVLDETTAAPTIEQTSKHPTTIFEQIFTVTQTPTTTYKQPKIPVDITKYTTLQYYSPTSTILGTPEQGTTLIQTPITNIDTTKEPSGETTFGSTFYTKIPTLEPEEELIKTTLGVTKIMGSSQNKTTEMIYYAAEETEAPTKGTTQTIVPTTFIQITQTSIGTTEATSSILETKTETATTPKRILTTIKADGSVSVKTTPISADEELFGATKSTSKKYKVTKWPKISTTSGPSDFLVDEGSSKNNKGPLYKKPLKDYSEDDIFGTAKSTTIKTTKKINDRKHYTKSDIEQALFDTGHRKSKALYRRKYSTTESPPNVVYSNFFEASTIPMTTLAHDTTTPTSVVSHTVTKGTIRNYFSIAKQGKIDSVTTETVPIATTMHENEKGNYKNDMPVTSQSYLTSISYEVNKRKKLFDSNSKGIIQNLSNGTIKKVDSTGEIKESRTTIAVPSYTTVTYDMTSVNDDFALRLIGQAKGVEYLDQTSTTGASTLASTSAKTTKKSKYTRRRSYSSKVKRPTRKKITVKNTEAS